MECKKLVEGASLLLEKEKPGVRDIKDINNRLIKALNPQDGFLINWRYIARQKGWLK